MSQVSFPVPIPALPPLSGSVQDTDLVIVYRPGNQTTYGATAGQFDSDILTRNNAWTGTNTFTGATTFNGPVTFAGGLPPSSLSPIPASTLLGNATGSVAAPSAITLGATLAFSGSALQTVAMTSDVTTAANSFATTVAKIQGIVVSGTTGTVNVVFSSSPTLTTPNIGAATGASLSVSGQLTSTVATGTAPLAVSSTTAVTNLNASLLLGSTWAAPAAIGTGTPAAGTFTTITATTSVTTPLAVVNSSSGAASLRVKSNANNAVGGVELTPNSGTNSWGLIPFNDGSFQITYQPTAGSLTSEIQALGFSTSGAVTAPVSLSTPTITTAGSVLAITPTAQFAAGLINTGNLSATAASSIAVLFASTGFIATYGADATHYAGLKFAQFHSDASGERDVLSFDTSGNATFSGTVTCLGGTTFLTTSSALTDGAGAGAGTITNAPTSGNPTKWIQINDNGTTRKIPTWT